MNNSDKIIISLCGGTGSWEKPYKDAGYQVNNITLPDLDIRTWFIEDNHLYFNKGKIENIGIRIPIDKIYGILAAPPCTMFSFARTRAKTPRDLRQGMKLVECCLRIIWEIRFRTKLKFWALENPKGYLRQFLGKPSFTFDPYEFGDDYTKPTDIWGYFNYPKKIETGELLKRWIKKNRSSKCWKWIKDKEIPSITDIIGSKDKIRRAMTPSGFAQAFFKANK